MATAVTPAVMDLWLSLNNTAELALSIPLAKCKDLAVNPLKWLQFLGYAIYGREGYLSMSDAGPPIENYIADIVACSYYFISPYPPRFVDVCAINDRISDLSSSPPRTSHFRDRIVQRDVTCVITDEIAERCQACHIIPHSKGDSYIAHTLSHRSGGDNVNEIDRINDPRNGLLLYKGLHDALGDGSLAVLKTPNFCLSVDDIPYSPPRQDNQASPTSRLTLHYMVDSRIGRLPHTIAPNNSDLREPEDTSNWPPALLVDIFYACAAVRAWAPASFIQTVQTMVKDAYYHASDDNTSEGSNGQRGNAGPSITPQADARKQRLDARNEKKTQAAHPTKTKFSSVMGGVVALWKRSVRRAKGNRQRPTASDLAQFSQPQ